MKSILLILISTGLFTGNNIACTDTSSLRLQTKSIRTKDSRKNKKIVWYNNFPQKSKNAGKGDKY